MLFRERHWPQAEEGQAVLEVALLLPVLLFLLMGIFVVGIWLNARQVVTAAAREGARTGAQTGSAVALEESVRAAMRAVDASEDRGRLQILAVSSPDNQRGSALTVQVIYKIPFSFDFFTHEYESVTATSSFPFSSVVAQATARLEVDYDSER